MERDVQEFRTVGRLAPAELAAFLAVARHGGFRAAGRATGLSPSALSAGVAALEERLKVQLFHRSTRAVSLTAAGARFAEDLGPAFERIAQAVEEVALAGARPTGQIRINAEANAAEQVLMPLVADFLGLHPGIGIEIVTETALTDIARGGFDCGLRAIDLVSPDMVAVPLGPRQQHIVVGAPSYLSRSPALRSPADLTAHICLQRRMPGGRLHAWEFERQGESFSVTTEGPLVLDSSRLIVAAARAGLGLAYVSRWSAAEALAEGTLVACLEAWTPPYPGLCLYYPRHRHPGAAMRAFVAFARTYGRDGPATPPASADRPPRAD